jgi:hypothetical protein
VGQPPAPLCGARRRLRGHWATVNRTSPSKTTTKGKNPHRLRAVQPAARAGTLDQPAVHMGLLQALDGERLKRLLALRPDLAKPAPDFLAELTECSQTMPSLYLALSGADVLVLQLGRILTLVGEKHAACSYGDGVTRSTRE